MSLIELISVLKKVNIKISIFSILCKSIIPFFSDYVWRGEYHASLISYCYIIFTNCILFSWTESKKEIIAIYVHTWNVTNISKHN